MLFSLSSLLCLCFFIDTPPTEIYTLSLHDALPISWSGAIDSPGCRGGHRCGHICVFWTGCALCRAGPDAFLRDRKSTRLNSSHLGISYAVFCLKKKITRNLPRNMQRPSIFATLRKH